MTLEGYDSSWVQGNYSPPAWADFGIVNASRANVGLTVGSHYHEQVDNLRHAGKHVGHYFFNGNTDPVRCADYFVDTLHDYRAGDTLWLDCEGEASTGTTGWTGTKALAWIQRVHQRTGAPYSAIGVYANAAILNAADWGPVARLGCPLWIAAWGYTPDAGTISPWTDWSVWQDGTRDGVDHNFSKLDLSTLAGGGATPIQQEDDDDMRLVWGTQGTGYLWGPAGRIALPSMAIYNLLYRIINCDQLKHPNAGFIKTWIPNAKQGLPQQFLPAELDIANHFAQLLTLQAQTGVKIDPDKLAQALKDAGADIHTEIDSEEIAKQIGDAFDKAIPRVSAAVVKQAGQKLAQ